MLRCRVRQALSSSYIHFILVELYDIACCCSLSTCKIFLSVSSYGSSPHLLKKKSSLTFNYVPRHWSILLTQWGLWICSGLGGWTTPRSFTECCPVFHTVLKAWHTSTHFIFLKPEKVVTIITIFTLYMEKPVHKKYVSCLRPCRLRLLTTIFYYFFVSNDTPKIVSATKKKKGSWCQKLKRGNYFSSRGQGRPP